MGIKTIKLISNSGLQFENYILSIDDDFSKKNKIFYVEEFNIEKEIFWFEEVIKNKKDDVWIKKSELTSKGFIDRNNNFTDEYSLEEVEQISEDDVKQNPNINKIIKSFSNKWIPIPFFKNNNINIDVFGPTDWVRLMITENKDGNYNASFVIDTKNTNDENDITSPFSSTNINDNIFSISKNTDVVLSFLDSRKGCDWILEYIQNEFIFDTSESSLIHIASFQILLKLLVAQENSFNIQLLPQKTTHVSVDMTVDIGNSTTCALLFEESDSDEFDFNKVKKLEIQDLKKPYISYNEPFSSDIAFSKPTFNDNFSKKNKFIWPSIIRFGKEANRLINSSNIEMSLDRNPISYSSSPKRYLWDKNPSLNNWEFLNDNMQIPQPVYLDGVTNHLQLDGSLVKNKEDIMGSSPKYSRSSLMTYMFLEIYANAFRQINSSNFRNEHGKIEHSRVIRNIVITCPTSMILEEQIQLRKASEDALELLKRNGYNISQTKTFPSIKELKRPLEDIEERKDWIYDEATCAQLVYMYSMISKKYNNAEKFFNSFSLNNKDLTVASIDIGGGTTDLMISSYTYENKNLNTIITPKPLFWETFNLAGDDLLKELIQQIIIEGNNDEGEGIIEDHLKNIIKDENYRSKLNSFFGEDSNNIGFKGKIMRKNFLNQVSKPIIKIFLDNVNNANKEFSYNDVYKNHEPCQELLKYFENHFEFNFKDIIWKTNSESIQKISKSIFDRLINQISKIIKLYDADILIMSGRTFKLKSIQELFETYQPVMANRMINMNNFWIGKWFPFSDSQGFVKDQKSVLSVGSLIALLSAKFNKMGNFRINTEFLQKSLVSNANNIGEIENDIVKTINLTESMDDGTMTVNKLPFTIGFKKISATNYPARNLYILDVNREAIFEKLNNQKKVDDFIYKIRESMPLKIEINRDLMKEKEKISLIEVTDNEENNLNKNYFTLQISTLKNKDSYWLDDGKFILKI